MASIGERFREWAAKLGWKHVQHLRAVLRPCWLAAVIVVAVSVALQVEQPRDALVAVAKDSGFFSWRHLGLLTFILTFAFSGWYFPRALLYVRYWFTPKLSETRYEAWRRWIPRILGALPIFSLAVAYFRSGKVAFGLTYVLVTTLFVGFLYARRKRLISEDRRGVFLHSEMPSRTFWPVMVFVAVSVLLLLVFVFSKVGAPQAIGPVGIVLLAAASWIAIGSMLLVYPASHYRLPSFVLLLLVLAGIFSLWNDNHHVRTLEGRVSSWSRPTVPVHFTEWLAYRKKAWQERVPSGEPYPVFVVAAEGGGTRAAYWTASVLARLEDRYPGFACHVFAISGVSGGSLGGAVFAALIAERLEKSEYRCDGRENSGPSDVSSSTRKILGRDFLGPTLAGMLFPDLYQRFSPLYGDFSLPDRAKYLELAWEDAWHTETGSHRFGESFQNLWQPESNRLQVPSLFFNGTWVENGHRNVTSSLRADTSLFVKQEDMIKGLDNPIPLSTAVHMSARFTYVSPAGTVSYDGVSRHVVDGGYFENSGTMTAYEIYNFLRELAKSNGSGQTPFAAHVLIISNDPENPNNLQKRATQKGTQLSFLRRLFPETQAPVRTLLRTRTARGFHADEFLSLFAGQSTVRFQLAQATDEKFPLGWMLSGEMRKLMDDRVCQLAEVDAVGKVLGVGPFKTASCGD